MKKLKAPIDYGKAAIETMMRKYKGEDLPPKGHFHYHQGVFLSGVYENYLICGEESYYQYIKSWVDAVLDKEGTIIEADALSLDDIQPGILLFPLYERTGDPRYKKALDELIHRIEVYPVNQEGGYWHKGMFAHEMWLDGLYMGGPFTAKFARKFNRPELFSISAYQALLMEEKTRDKETGLWYHAYDCERKAEWADKMTGCSPEFWGRSIGWVPVAVLDELDEIDKIDAMPETHSEYHALELLVESLLKAVCQYQSEDGRWYQVVDEAGREGNWQENSCSCLYTAAISRAVRRGILGQEYMENAKKGYEGVIRSLTWNGEDLLLGEVCIGTGVGDYEHYCNRPVSVNDLHGMGAFLLMCAEMEIGSQLYAL